MTYDQLPPDVRQTMTEALERGRDSVGERLDAWTSRGVTFLLTVNGGGAAACLAFAGAMLSSGNDPAPAALPFAIFAAGLAALGVSLIARMEALAQSHGRTRFLIGQWVGNGLRLVDVQGAVERALGGERVADYATMVSFVCAIGAAIIGGARIFGWL